MATFNGIYKVLNSSGTYDQVNLRTTAEQVVESTSKRFVSDSEKSTWNSKANASHTHTSAHITDATSENTSNTIVKRDSNGNFKAGTVTANLSGNASTATTLQTPRTIAISGGATGTATSFNGSSNISIPITDIKESYLSWGGRNFSGTYGPLDASLIPELGANRLAFMPSNAVTVEYSRDGGTTWTTYSTSDSNKINLFNGNGAGHVIGADSTTGIDKSKYMLRITITAEKSNVYSQLNKFAIYCSTNGSSGSYCTIDVRTQANYKAGNNTWTTLVSKQGISGWSGWNIINTNFILGINNDQYGQLRFTFGVTSHTSSVTYPGLNISKIVGYGGVGWGTPSTMAACGRMYTYDANQNVTFPAVVAATSFSGNASSATKATQDSSGQKITSTYIKGLSVSGQTITYTKGDGTTGTLSTQDTNTDTKVTNTLNTTAKAYITGTTSSSTNTGTQVFDTGVYLDTTAGTLTATTFKGALEGNAKTATTATTCSGNAATATKLQNARTINGVSFNGTANITIKADPNAHTHAHTEITGLGTAATLNTGTSSGNIPVLGSGGKLSTSVLPSVSINDTHTVETVDAALKLSCEVGDVVIITSYVQPANLEESILSKETQRALNSGSNTFICINSSATTFDAKFKVLMSSSDAVTHAEFNTSLNNKVDKVSGKGLSTNDYTTTEKNKLAGIAANANNYVHPSTHDASMITQSSSYRFVTDTEKSTWNNKANSSHNHDSTYLKLSGGSVTGNIIFNNNVGVQGKNTSGTAYTLAKVNASNQAYLGTESLPAVVASSANPKVRVGSNEYTMYHTGNKPTASDVGALTQSTADNRYRNKTDLVFTDTISIVTPAS